MSVSDHRKLRIIGIVVIVLLALWKLFLSITLPQLVGMERPKPPREEEARHERVQEEVRP